MIPVYWDLETFSQRDLTQCGAFIYAVDESTDVPLMCYAVGDDEIHAWRPGDPVPAPFADPTGYKFIADNWDFERHPGGSPEATRRAFNKRFLLDLAEDWQQHGREVFKRVRRESPAAYLKVCAMLVPREMKLEHSGGIKAMTTEQIERSIEFIKEMIAKRDAAANANVIEGTAERIPEVGK